ncbi:hypothetical protein [Flavobacterium luteolum]|uniref:hypothetical protein n=1 Tax=Flavobacterium luteolum TaxID=3003259 RepID=UPI00248EED9A|nr:hypothetical protein [Flavobacterium luteolum]
MKKIIWILAFFSYINLNAQEKTNYKLNEIQSFNSFLEMKTKDKYTVGLNKKLQKTKKNFSFIPIKKGKQYWIYLMIDKKQLFSMKSDDLILSKSEIYIYDVNSNLLISVNYDDANRTRFEKRMSKYYCEFYLPYSDIDSVDMFNTDLYPDYSIKYTGSLALIDEPIDHRPFCIYNYKMDSFYYFENNTDKLYFELEEININDLYEKVALLKFNSNNNINRFNVRFRNRLLLNVSKNVSD